MSSTYSTNLRTELIGSGDQAGTWGNTTNTSLGSILEQAIAGVSGGPYISGTYPAVNFPTDADITLTANNGSVDQSRSMVLVITSSGSLTATRNVIAPASASKIYIIKNSTTGGQSIQIKYATGTGVTIGNGLTALVYGDGTNFNIVANPNSVTGNLAVSGTLAVTGAQTNSSTLQATTITATTQFSGPGTGLTGTAADLTAGNVTNPFPSGTRLVFAQASAPTGWTQDVSDTANNRMLRVVNTTGGGIGGSSDPTLMNVVPSHTHTVSSSGTTGTESVGHTHTFSGTTAGMDSNNPHSHSGGDYGHSHSTASYITPNSGGNPGFDSGGLYSPTTANSGTGVANANIYINATDINHGHSYSGTTSGISANHTHNVTVSGTTDNGSSQTNWTPRYNNVIICQKN